MKPVKVYFNKYESKSLMGFATVGFSLDDSDRVHLKWNGIKVFRSQDGGIFLGMPAEKDKKGATDDQGNPKWWDIITIYTKEDEDTPGQQLKDDIRIAIENEISKMNSSDHQPPKNTRDEPRDNSDYGRSDIPDDDIPF